MYTGNNLDNYDKGKLILMLDKTFVFVSEVCPTSFAYTHAKFEREALLKGQVRCLKTAT